MNNCGTLPIEEVHLIKGRGVVAVGRVTNGRFNVWDDITIMRQDGTQIKSKIRSFEMYGNISYVLKGDNVGMLLLNIQIDDINAGDIIMQI